MCFVLLFATLRTSCSILSMYYRFQCVPSGRGKIHWFMPRRIERIFSAAIKIDTQFSSCIFDNITTTEFHKLFVWITKHS
ncbi:hypothetical protein FKM82_015368 [Ascaphus truei]